MPYTSLLIINSSGSLLYSHPLTPLPSNTLLRIASTFHSLHVISSQASPVAGDDGIKTISATVDGAEWALECLKTPTNKLIILTSSPPMQSTKKLKEIYVKVGEMGKDAFWDGEMPMGKDVESVFESVLRD